MLFRPFLFLVLLAGILPCEAENTSSPPAESKKPPVDNSAFIDYVPKGWRLQNDRILGIDIDGDGMKDAILTLIEDEGPQIISRPGYRADARALLVLLGEKNGRYRRSSFAKDVLLCASCAGMMGRFESEEQGSIYFEKNTFIVSWISGSSEIVDVTLNFGFNPDLKQFVLLSETVENRNRNVGAFTLTERDFVAGTKTVSGESFAGESLASGQRKNIPPKTTKIEKQVIPIEAVKYYDYKYSSHIHLR